MSSLIFPVCTNLGLSQKVSADFSTFLNQQSRHTIRLLFNTVQLKKILKMTDTLIAPSACNSQVAKTTKLGVIGVVSTELNSEWFHSAWEHFLHVAYADVSMLVHWVVTGNVEHLKQGFSNISHLFGVCVCVCVLLSRRWAGKWQELLAECVQIHYSSHAVGISCRLHRGEADGAW